MSKIALDSMQVSIDGEVLDVDKIYGPVGFKTPGVSRVEVGNREYYLAASEEAAGKLARERWQDTIDHDKEEFVCMISKDRLVQWAVGESDSFGISSADEFLDAIESAPEEELASHDGEPREVDGAAADLVEELGFVPTVAYRYN